jgi:hypothetical protein
MLLIGIMMPLDMRLTILAIGVGVDVGWWWRERGR